MTIPYEKLEHQEKLKKVLFQKCCLKLGIFEDEGC